MKRDRIIIEDNTVVITGSEVWMTSWKLAELFHSTIPCIRAKIKRAFKNSALEEYEHSKCIRLDYGLWGEVYSLEVITAVSFFIETYNARLFRKWIKQRLLSSCQRPPCVILSINDYEVCD